MQEGVQNGGEKAWRRMGFSEGPADVQTVALPTSHTRHSATDDEGHSLTLRVSTWRG